MEGRLSRLDSSGLVRRTLWALAARRRGVECAAGRDGAAGADLDRHRDGGRGRCGARRLHASGRRRRPARARGKRPARQLERTARGLSDSHRAHGGTASRDRRRGPRLAGAGHAGAAGSGTAPGRVRRDVRHRRRPCHRGGPGAGRLRGAGLAPLPGVRRAHVLHPGDRQAGVPGPHRARRSGAHADGGRAVREDGLHRGGRRRSAANRFAAPGRARRRGRRAGAAGAVHGRRNHRRLPERGAVPRVHPARRVGRGRAGMVRGTRPVGHPGPHPHRRTRAEPDAVRAADDPDQSGDHRGGRPRRLAAARLLAGKRLRPGHGAGVRRARARGDPDRRDLRHDQRLALVQPRHRTAVRRADAGDVRRRHDRLLALPEPLRRRGPPGGARSCWRSAWAAWRRSWRAPASRRS